MEAYLKSVTFSSCFQSIAPVCLEENDAGASSCPEVGPASVFHQCFGRFFDLEFERLYKYKF